MHLFVPLIVGLTAFAFAMLSFGGWRLARTWRGSLPSRWAVAAVLVLGTVLLPVGVYAALIELVTVRSATTGEVKEP